MHLYLVTNRRTATALLEDSPLNWTESLMLDDIEDGTVRVPELVFYDFSWLRDLMNESESDRWDQWLELTIDFPAEVLKPYEAICPEGGNSTWHVPQALVRGFITRTTPNAAFRL